MNADLFPTHFILNKLTSINKCTSYLEVRQEKEFIACTAYFSPTQNI